MRHYTGTLPIQDPATGLRRGAIRHPNGQPPTQNGCRWCGTDPEKHYGQHWVPSVGWHTWTQPTNAQVLARTKSRRTAKES